MLSNEQLFFLQCLSDFCNEKPTVPPAYKADLRKVAQYGKAHSLGGILYYQYGDRLNSVSGIHEAQMPIINDLYHSVNRTALMKEVINLFEENHIPFLCMKGSVFRNYYPVPALRSMGDVDLIIRPCDKEKADEVFVKHLNFMKFVDNHAVWTYFLKTFQFEVHNHMFYEHLTNDFDYIGYFDQIFEHKHHAGIYGNESDYMYVPDDNYHFLYLMTHTAKHIINKGAGFRAYLDMVMFAKKADLDWEWIAEELKRMHLFEFTQTCFALCEEWFKVKMPLAHKKLDPVFYESITAKTFNDGVFGLENTENEGAHTAKEIRREQKGYWITALRLTLNLLFPPYQDLVLIPWYSLIRGRPWLLPVIWIYRWFYCLTHKFTESITRITEPFRIRKKIEKREDYIRSWGL